MRTRLIVGALSLSAIGFVGLISHEGYTDKAVIPINGDVPTIGHGTTAGVKLGDTTTPTAAIERAMRDVVVFEGAIKQCVKVPLSQGEYDAYVDLAYNIGASGFCRSTVVKRLNTGDYRGACDAILMWRFAAGRDCSNRESGRLGLWKRRLKTYEQCVASDAS